MSKLNIGESKVISVCKHDKRSNWANNQSKNTDKGMKEVVTISKNSKGQKISITSYQSK